LCRDFPVHCVTFCTILGLCPLNASSIHWQGGESQDYPGREQVS
jgi:hypothetical protein